MGNDLAYMKLYFEDIDNILNTLKLYEVGQWLKACSEYAQTGVWTETGDRTVDFCIRMQVAKMDGAMKAYEKKCAVNAENGRKGGKAKAANAKAKAEAEAETGPTQSATDPPAEQKPEKDFVKPTLSMVKKLMEDVFSKEMLYEECGDDELPDLSSYDFADFFKKLKDENFVYKGIPLKSSSDLKGIFVAKFPPTRYNGERLSGNLVWAEFNHLIAKGGEWIDQNELDLLNVAWVAVELSVPQNRADRRAYFIKDCDECEYTYSQETLAKLFPERD